MGFSYSRFEVLDKQVFGRRDGKMQCGAQSRFWRHLLRRRGSWSYLVRLNHNMATDCAVFHVSSTSEQHLLLLSSFYTVTIVISILFIAVVVVVGSVVLLIIDFICT